MRRPSLVETSALALALMLALAPSGLAKRAAPPPPPRAGDPQIPFETLTLDNGLEVILMPDARTPIVFVDVWYHVGSGDEVPGRSGFAHLFEHMMFQGTPDTGEDQHFKVLQKIGASNVNGTTNTNRTNYFEQIPSNQLEVALWLESERMGYLLDGLTPKSLQNQIDVVRNERRQRYDNVAYRLSDLRMSEEMFPEGHPYRYQTIGRHQDLELAKIDDVRAFFRTWYVPANATLTIAGDFDAAQAKQLVQKWFGGFPRTSRPERRHAPMPVLAAAAAPVVVTDPLAKFTRVQLAWHSPASLAPGDAELDLLANALGAEGTGRLYQALVLDHKIARGVMVYQESMQQSSLFKIVIDLVPGGDPAVAEQLALAELAKVSSAPLDARELARAVLAFEAGVVYGLETVQARAEQLQECNHLTGKPDCLTENLDRYRRATSVGVQTVAAEVFTRFHRTVVTVPGGDAAAHQQEAR